MTQKLLIPRAAVPGHIFERTGLVIAKNTLSKMANRGGGPEYRIFGKTAYYTEAALDAWVAEKLSPPKR